MAYRTIIIMAKDKENNLNNIHIGKIESFAVTLNQTHYYKSTVFPFTN